MVTFVERIGNNGREGNTKVMAFSQHPAKAVENALWEYEIFVAFARVIFG